MTTEPTKQDRLTVEILERIKEDDALVENSPEIGTTWKALEAAEIRGDRLAMQKGVEKLENLYQWTVQERAKDCTESLRYHLRRMIKGNRGLNKAAQDALMSWAAEARIENLAEWLNGTPPQGDEGEYKGGHWGAVDEAALLQDLEKIKKPPHWIYGSKDQRGVHVYAFNWGPSDGEPDLGAMAEVLNVHPSRLGFSGGVDAVRTLFFAGGWDYLSHTLSQRKGHWLAVLAKPWLAERLERVEREAEALPIAIRPISETESGNRWTPLPRALDVASVMGGPYTVQVDGESYTPEPDFAAPAIGHILSPRGVDIVPGEWLERWDARPEQMRLALDVDTPPDALQEYMVETATKTAHLAKLGNMCPKLMGFMFACQPVSGRGIKGTLGEVAEYIYPDFKERHQQTRDLKTLGAAFVAIKGLRIVHTKPDGVRHPYDLFTLDYDLSSKADAELGWMLNPWLVERMQGGPGGGFFLLNMTRWLSMGTQNPRLFPLALRLASIWDKARVNGIYSPSHLHAIEADRLAWECNSLPEGAAKFRAGKSDGRSEQNQLIRARQKLESDLDTLKEVGLLGNWEKKKVHGAGFTVRPVPPDDYPEACRRAVDNLRKPKKARK